MLYQQIFFVIDILHFIKIELGLIHGTIESPVSVNWAPVRKDGMVESVLNGIDPGYQCVQDNLVDGFKYDGV